MCSLLLLFSFSSGVQEMEGTIWVVVDTLICLQDGADSGYGAKAQEILGQVRGR